MIKTYTAINRFSVTYDVRDVIGISVNTMITVTLSGYVIQSLAPDKKSNMIDLYCEMVDDWMKAKEERRTIELKDALTAVDEWLNSDATWTTDKDGEKNNGLIACEPGSMSKAFISKMTTPNSGFREKLEKMKKDRDER